MFSEKELLETAAQYGLKRFALTDINNTSAALNFIRLAPSYHIKPIVGIDFRNGIKQHYVGLAKNNKGYLALNNFLSKHIHHNTPFPDEAPVFENAFIVYPFEQALLIDKQTFLPHEYIGIRLSDLRKVNYSKLSSYQDKMVLLHTVSFRNQRDFNTHRLLRAVDKNVLLSKLPLSEQADPTQTFVHPKALKAALEHFPILIYNTEKLMETCEIHFDFSEKRPPQNLKTYTGTQQGDMEMLNQLCTEGLRYRYPNITEEIENRVEKELGLIRQMNFMSFFLTNWDIVDYAKRMGYYHVGRGSGANSIIAYLLGITDVDPIDLDLYFERFMNLYRKSPPDFDIDFSWRDRQDVTRYIFDRFSGEHGRVALLGTYNTFKHKGAVRELGKVFGLPKHEMDILSSGKFDFRKLEKLPQLVIRYTEFIKGMPNLLSVHSAGIVISEKPIHYFTATNLPPKGFPTTHFDMISAEDVGLYKYDILGQRGLGKIKDAIQIVEKNYPEAPKIDIHDVKPFMEDPKINRMVSQAECIGCFYVESPAMRMLLKKLEVDNYLGLVAASSIIRPGVSQSGMMKEYILRHKNPERRNRAHPVMMQLMEDTYGVMVYQEDVIKVAHHFAGLSLGESDVLRRAMSGKYRSREEFQKVKDKFFNNCKERGYEDRLTNEVWLQIESFAGYAFAKGHSASYAVESYQSLFLKTYYPLEFMVAVLNNGGGFYRAETYIHETRRLGGIIHGPCVNTSLYETTIKGKNIYLGFQHLQGLDSKLAYRITKERLLNGSYKSVDDLVNRIPIGIENLDILIRINAFRFTGMDKRTLLWKGHFKTNRQIKRTAQRPLFDFDIKEFDLPEFSITSLENAFDEIELLGFPLSDPFLLLEKALPSSLLAIDMKDRLNQNMVLYGYLVTIKNTKTKKGTRMYFGTFLDQAGEWIDTVHFPPVAKAFPFRGRGIYRLEGQVMEEFGFLTLEVKKMHRLNYIEDPRFALNAS